MDDHLRYYSWRNAKVNLRVIISYFASRDYAESMVIGRADQVDLEELFEMFEDFYDIVGSHEENRYRDLPEALDTQLRSFRAAARAAIFTPREEDPRPDQFPGERFLRTYDRAVRGLPADPEDRWPARLVSDAELVTGPSWAKLQRDATRLLAALDEVIVP